MKMTELALIEEAILAKYHAAVTDIETVMCHHEAN